jgi:hypothetical protein
VATVDCNYETSPDNFGEQKPILIMPRGNLNVGERAVNGLLGFATGGAASALLPGLPGNVLGSFLGAKLNTHLEKTDSPGFVVPPHHYLYPVAAELLKQYNEDLERREQQSYFAGAASVGTTLLIPGVGHALAPFVGMALGPKEPKLPFTAKLLE